MKKHRNLKTEPKSNFKTQIPRLDQRDRVNYRETSLEDLILHEEASGDGQQRHDFDLEQRTTNFGVAIVNFAKKIPQNPTNNRLIGQLVGCGTSIGANYCEASESLSKRDFLCSIARCKKEAKETKYFLQMVVASEPSLAKEARDLYREAKELHLIFASIFRKRS